MTPIGTHVYWGELLLNRPLCLLCALTGAKQRSQAGRGCNWEGKWFKKLWCEAELSASILTWAWGSYRRAQSRGLVSEGPWGPCRGVSPGGIAPPLRGWACCLAGGTERRKLNQNCRARIAPKKTRNVEIKPKHPAEIAPKI